MNKSEIRSVLDSRLLSLIMDYYKFSNLSRYQSECYHRMLEVCRIAFQLGVLNSDDLYTLVSIIVMINTDEPMEERI